jgi:POT family proton-dependent oligopeptide transporter
MSEPAKTGKHPKGLYVLFATEMWERFNFYGMRAILFLFMTQALLYEKAYASNLYGSYIGLIYLTPLIGGYIADRYWGNKRSIIVGGLMMAIGEIFLFGCASVYDGAPGLSTFLFFSGLGFMIAGNGFFKPNISSLVGQLYPQGDTRLDAAYTIFYMGINIGAALGPLVCGWVGETGNPADFKWAFLAGGVGMLISVVIQKLYQSKYVVSPEGKPLGESPGQAVLIDPHTSKDQKITKQPSKNWLNPIFIMAGMLLFAGVTISAMYLDAKVFSYLPYLLLASALFIVIFILSDKTINKTEKQRIGVIFIVSFFVIFFWAAYEQTGASLTIFAAEQTNRQLGNYTVPASFFQSLNPIFIVLFAPVFAWVWIKMGKKQPATPTKMALGLFFLALGYLWISYGVSNMAPDKKASMIWLTVMYALHTWGELCLSPIGLSLVNKLAPLKFASLLMAVWFLANAAGNKLAGVLSALYPDGGKATLFLGYKMTTLFDFFMLFVVMAGLASFVLFLLSKKLQKMMHGLK